MELVGRYLEKQILTGILEKPESQFVAMYGRRRIGKTFLIRRTFQKNMVFECSGLIEGDKHAMLENFWNGIKKINNNTEPIKRPRSWIKAFSELEKCIEQIPNSKKKKVIFLDELPWFDTPKSGFMPAFANFWNSFCSKRSDILLIICGSAASWIIRKIVNARGGLHNRLHRTIRLEPFTLVETKLFLRAKKVQMIEKDICQLYMCIGGIPFYLDQIQNGKSISQILDDLFFRPAAILASEFTNLYAALFKNHEKHLSVVKALHTKTKGLTRSEIIKASFKNSGGGLSLVLQELEECGFVQKHVDYDKPKEDGLYRLVDEFTIFYFKHIYEKRGQIKAHELVNSNAFRVWSGYAFENLCFRHIHKIAEVLGISGINFNVFSFVDKGSQESTGAQIDMVIDRADNCVNIIEIKFQTGKYILSKKEFEHINNRVNSFRKKTKTKKTVFVTLITPDGAETNPYFSSIISNEILLKNLI